MTKASGICAGFLLPHPPVIVPAVGLGREKEAAATVAAYERVAQRAKELEPDTVVVVSPHAPLFSDYVFMYDAPSLEGSFEKFGAPRASLRFDEDTELRRRIEKLMRAVGIPGGSLESTERRRFDITGELDHGVLVPLHFFSQFYKWFRLVAMSCSGLDIGRLYTLGGLIGKAAGESGKRAVIIASGDMSHKVNAQSPYGACPEGAQFDGAVREAVEKSDIPALLSIDPVLREKSAECGYRSIVILCGAFDKTKLESKLYSYEAPFGIGYLVAEFSPAGKTSESAFSASHKTVVREGENPYVTIARATLEACIRQKALPTPEDFAKFKNETGLFEDRAGVFVSLKKHGELRGCIGTTAPTAENVAAEIIRNAVSAGTRDPRFEPVAENELDFIDYSVDVLSPAEPADPSQLDPKRYGVIVKNGGRSGLLLPDLEGVDTAERQLLIACRKAGIDPEEHFDVYRFTVTRHSAKKDGEIA